MRNLDIALASAGATRDDLIRQTIFVVDYRPEIVPLIQGPALRDASTCRQLGRRRPSLFARGYLVEIEAVARVPAA